MSLATSTLRRTPNRLRGFTMIEVMIVVAIVGILAAIAFPSFLDSIRKSRRSDAFTALSAVQQAQERWRGNTSAYAANDLLTVARPEGLGLRATSSKAYYAVSIDTAGATGYTATATAISGTSQSHDSNCSTLRVRVAGGNIQYGGCSGCDVPEGVLSDPNRCWVQ